MNKLYLCMSALLGALLALPATAQDPLPWYEVEVIVFAQREPTGEDTERWRGVVPPPQAPDYVSLRDPSEQAQAEQPEPFTRLPEQELRLHAVYAQLQQAAAYRPLLHLGWRQQGLPQREAPAVAIPTDWVPLPPLPPLPAQDEVQEPEELEGEPAEIVELELTPPLYGFIQVYRERFLHANVDLRYRLSATDQQEDPSLEGQDPLLVLKQRRRMRSGELHYLDHPAMGVIIQVTPIEETPEAASEEEQ